MRTAAIGGVAAAAMIAAAWAAQKPGAPVPHAAEEEAMRAPDGERSLTDAEKKTLLRIARDAVEAYVRSRDVVGLGGYPSTPALREKRGAFVTITNPAASSPVHPEPLRGCIGNFVSAVPLLETVRDMAIDACSRDGRFPPVQAAELKDIRLEISALSPLLPVADPLSIRRGVHGIYIRDRLGRGGGTYLPQVWSEHFPERDAAYFWTHLCRNKAGLPDDAWKHPDQYEVLVYTADVFGEDR
ncbi:MAG TPA: AmmeMemoRadiSam system protein A [bacterium]|jgi:AmmeMemoRadiSam system protein A|nr:AmmeMemoRadiSam system protein A [Chlamydiota bacterium]HOE28338.1 AmmeMemoRadiSam system protein A [bacterium]HQM53549.1 AmmeMemoRadiSam system protein A [bacterium]